MVAPTAGHSGPVPGRIRPLCQGARRPARRVPACRPVGERDGGRLVRTASREGRRARSLVDTPQPWRRNRPRV